MCDMRFAAAGAKFTTAFARRGLIAEYGMSWMLPRLVGTARALDLLLSGRVFLAEEAAAMGLVNEVVAPEHLLDHALALRRGPRRQRLADVDGDHEAQVYADATRCLRAGHRRRDRADEGLAAPTRLQGGRRQLPGRSARRRSAPWIRTRSPHSRASGIVGSSASVRSCAMSDTSDLNSFNNKIIAEFRANGGKVGPPVRRRADAAAHHHRREDRPAAHVAARVHDGRGPAGDHRLRSVARRSIRPGSTTSSPTLR